MSAVASLTATRDRKAAHALRTRDYYDECPDPVRRAKALETLSRLNREVEALDEQIYRAWEQEQEETNR